MARRLKPISRRFDKPVFFHGLWEPVLGEDDGRHAELYGADGEARDWREMGLYLPWTRAELTGGWLRKRGILDRHDRVLYWEFAHGWHGFFWWDRSARDEPGQCSAFLAYQFPLLWRLRALTHCLRSFRHVVDRQGGEFELHGKTAHRNGKLGER